MEATLAVVDGLTIGTFELFSITTTPGNGTNEPAVAEGGVPGQAQAPAIVAIFLGIWYAICTALW